MRLEQLSNLMDQIVTALSAIEQAIAIAFAVTEIGVTAKHLANGSIAAQPFTGGLQRLEHFLIVASGIRLLALSGRFEPAPLGDVAQAYGKFGGRKEFVEAPRA